MTVSSAASLAVGASQAVAVAAVQIEALRALQQTEVALVNALAALADGRGANLDVRV